MPEKRTPPNLFARAVLGATAMRRRSRGPLREAWPLELEALSRVLHHYAKRSHRLPLAWQRSAIHAFTRAPDRRVSVARTSASGVPVAWLEPQGADRERVLVYLHGGGYSIGSIDSHLPFVAKLARRAGVRALMVDYRLAPEHRFPAQLDDTRAVWRFLRDAGVAPERTVLAGESAGGGLTMSTLLMLRDEGEALPAAAAVLSPWVDLTLASGSIDDNARFDYVHRHVLEVYARRFVADHARGDPRVSPVFADLRGLPPLLVQVGEAEALLDDARALVMRAVDHGVDVELSEYADMFHAFQLFAGLPEANAAVDELAAFIGKHTGSLSPE